MSLMRMPAQHFHDCVLFHALQGLDVATVAHDCKAQAGTCGLTIDGDRARAACPVLASEMRGGQAAALAQEISQGFTRLHLVTGLITVQFKRDGHHLLCISCTARSTVDVWRRK